MFYETRILDAYGNLKKIISGKELQKRHWENFKFMEENISFFAKKDQKKDVKKQNTEIKFLSDDTY